MGKESGPWLPAQIQMRKVQLVLKMKVRAHTHARTHTPAALSTGGWPQHHEQILSLCEICKTALTNYGMC